MAPVADLVDADEHEAFEPVGVEVIGDDALDDRADGSPADPQQPGDRREGHLLGQPRDGVLEVAGVTRARPRPWDGFEPDPAVAAPELAQLALDPAARRAEIEVPPALDAAPVDLQRPDLAARRAAPSAAPQPDRHDDALRAEADVDHGCPGQAEQPLECRGDAHVALLARPLSFEQPAACAPGGGASPAHCATSEELLQPRNPCRRGHRHAQVTHNSTGDPNDREAYDGQSRTVSVRERALERHTQTAADHARTGPGSGRCWSPRT